MRVSSHPHYRLKMPASSSRTWEAAPRNFRADNFCTWPRVLPRAGSGRCRDRHRRPSLRAVRRCPAVLRPRGGARSAASPRRSRERRCQLRSVQTCRVPRSRRQWASSADISQPRRGRSRSPRSHRTSHSFCRGEFGRRTGRRDRSRLFIPQVRRPQLPTIPCSVLLSASTCTCAGRGALT